MLGSEVGCSLLYLQARNEPDVYETSDLPEDDQAEFDAVRLCAASGLGTLTSLPQAGPFPFLGSHSNKRVCQSSLGGVQVTGLAKALLCMQLPMSSARKECRVSGIPTNKTTLDL